MSKPIFTSLSPNLECDDLRLVLKLLFQPWKWIGGDAIQNLENKFKQRFQTKQVFSFASGRGALLAILSSLGLEKEDEVLLQAYTCVAVPDAVIWAGGTPIYVDIEENTFNMSPEDLEKKITSKSRAVIVQHTFGQPANLEKLLEVAKKNNLLVIEDCAHALGAEFNGKETGTFGDAAFFSFGRDKVISSVFGGLAVINNESFASGMEETYKNFATASRFWVLKQLCQPVITWLAKKTYNFLGLGKGILWLFKQLGILSRAVEKGEKRARKPNFLFKKMPNALAKLVCHQLNKLESFNAHRRKIADLYDKELLSLSSPNFLLPRGASGIKHIYLRYTITSPKAEILIKEARKTKIFLGDWYNNVVAPRGVNLVYIKYKEGSCPAAEKLANISFNLPTDININEKEALAIIRFLKRNV